MNLHQPASRQSALILLLLLPLPNHTSKDTPNKLTFAFR